MKKTVLLVSVILALMSCSKKQDDLAILAEWMTGSFSSQDQSIADTSYLDIRLEMVPIWKERNDGYWIYVEQAVATHLNQPYRQRVYHVTRIDEHTFSSKVYAIPDPLRFAGDWKKKIPLKGLTPDSLINRKGCEIILKKIDENHFKGSTVAQNCESKLRGASYATSEVVIRKDVLLSWDRGFDADGNQVWGAEKGGYIFKKKPPVPAD